MRNRGPSPRVQNLLDQLQAIYAEADQHHSTWSCPKTAECCHFGITGKEPFVTTIELAEIERALRAQGREPAPPDRRAKENEKKDPKRVCPMLTEGLRCSIYASRPLGCRTFFCHRADRGEKVPHQAWRDIVRRIEDLARLHRKDGQIGRPLGRILGRPSTLKNPSRTDGPS